MSRPEWPRPRGLHAEFFFGLRVPIPPNAVAGGMLCYLLALCGPVALVIGLKSLNAIKANPVWIQPKEPRATTHPDELIRPTVFADSTV